MCPDSINVGLKVCRYFRAEVYNYYLGIWTLFMIDLSAFGLQATDPGYVKTPDIVAPQQTM